MNEIWKDIEGYEGLYQVSNFGRVKSLNYRRTKKESILKLIKHKYGYLFVMLHKNKKLKSMLVHRLVAQAFIPNPDNIPQVNHKDEDKTNNCVENLEWCDGEYNSNYGTRNERVAKVNSKPVLQYSINGEFIREWPSTMQIQRELGFSSGNISVCCRGKYKQAYGYKWVYKQQMDAA